MSIFTRDLILPDGSFTESLTGPPHVLGKLVC